MGMDRGILLFDRIKQLGAAEFNRWVFAPEVSYRLFYQPCNKGSLVDFFSDTLDAELIRSNKLYGTSKKVWSGLGDFFYIPPNKRKKSSSISHNSLNLANSIPLDFISPFSLSINVLDKEDGFTDVEDFACLYSLDENVEVLLKLENSMQVIKKISPHVYNMITKFTKVMVVRTDGTTNDIFTSATSTQYLGRTLLVNPHLEFVDTALLTDGIVHEAMHSVLYMLERAFPWVHDRDLYFDETVLVQSPWSGRMLKLRPFLQANFIWYGLYNFWKKSSNFNILENELSLFYMERAISGFLKDDILETLSPYKYGICNELLEVIGKMQKSMISETN